MKSTGRMGYAIYAALCIGATQIAAQEAGAAAADPKAQLQQKLAAFKKSLAENQKALQQYSWTETTEISLKGEVKKTEQKQCRYGADGKVIKTAVPGAASEPAAESSKGGRGRRGGRAGGAVKEHIVENKVEDMKEYMEKVAALVKEYVPPQPAKIQASQAAGKAALNKEVSPGVSELAFTDFAHPGDKLTLGFNGAAKSITNVNVNSYLDEPKDTVTLAVRYAGLPDGVNYPAETVLVAKAKEIQVKITNAGYKKN